MNKGKVYCFADLHGNLNLFKQIKNFIQAEDKVFVLGDVIDRGTEGWKILKEILKDDRFILLKGNHEQMLVNSGREFLKNERCLYGDDIYLHMNNGGLSTLLDWSKEKNAIEYLNLINKFPVYEQYINKNGIKIHLSHAGFSPNNISGDEFDFLWNRLHYKFRCLINPNELIVHGHTPIPLMIEDIGEFRNPPKYEGGACWYNNNQKVNLDLGTHWSKQIILFDLDTFDEHIFSTQGE